MSFKLTYGTMFDPPTEVHTHFEAALRDVEARIGARHALFIGGRDAPGAAQFVKRSPIDERMALGEFPAASAAQVDEAVTAAVDAFPIWRATRPQERIRLVRRIGELIA